MKPVSNVEIKEKEAACKCRLEYEKGKNIWETTRQAFWTMVYYEEAE